MISEGELKQRLANTYAGEPTGWDRVQQFREVQQYAGTHPQKGSTAISTALELPRGRIRPWLDGKSKPEPVKAIETAEDKGWFTLSGADSRLPPLTAILAWIYAGGGIDRQFVPHFSIDNERQKGILGRALAMLNLDFKYRHEADKTRSTECVVGENATVFGRLLVAMGAPQGTKNSEESIRLPDRILAAPQSIQLVFARTYTIVRGAENPGRENWPIQFAEDRPAGYHRQLKSLFRDVIDERPAITGQETSSTLYLSRQAGEILDKPPQILEET